MICRKAAGERGWRAFEVASPALRADTPGDMFGRGRNDHQTGLWKQKQCRET
jgi:hypothetical protein